MTILQGFADASGKASNLNDKVLTVNGCLSTPEKWQQFDSDWQAYLKAEHFEPDPKTGRFIFHTAPFLSGNCKLMPKNLSKFAKHRIYMNLIWLVRKYTEFRFGYGVWLEDYRRFELDFPGANIILKQAGTYASRLCFTWNSVWAEENGYDSSIAYVFDRGDEFWGEMFNEYRHLRKKKVDHDSLTVSGLTDGDKADYSQIQAADLVAWESRNYFMGLSHDHLSERLPPKRTRMELNRLGDPKKIDIRLYRYKEFLSELIGNVQEGLEKRGSLNKYVGNGKLFSTIEDYTRATLAVAKQEQEAEKRTLLEAWFAKKANEK